MTEITGRAVLVTGANRGVGQEFVTQFLRRGARKVYAGSRATTAVDTSGDDRVVPLQLDVTDPATITEAVRIAEDVSILVNNAGISQPTSVLSPDVTALHAQLGVNLLGPLALTSAFATRLSQRNGAVINVHSVLSWLGLGGTYSVSKAALWSATESMRLEFEPRGVHVLGLFMGYVDTDMTAGVSAPKASTTDVVNQTLDGLEAGVYEILADEVTRQVHAELHRTAEERYARFTAQDTAIDVARPDWP